MDEQLKRKLFHDVKASLNGISLCLETLKESLGNEEEKKEVVDVLDRAMIKLQANWQNLKKEIS